MAGSVSNDIEVSPNPTVSLTKMVSSNFMAVLKLQVAPDDQQTIATNDRSMEKLRPAKSG